MGGTRTLGSRLRAQICCTSVIQIGHAQNYHCQNLFVGATAIYFQPSRCNMMEPPAPPSPSKVKQNPHTHLGHLYARGDILACEWLHDFLRESRASETCTRAKLPPAKDTRACSRASFPLLPETNKGLLRRSLGLHSQKIERADMLL